MWVIILVLLMKVLAISISLKIIQKNINSKINLMKNKVFFIEFKFYFIKFLSNLDNRPFTFFLKPYGGMKVTYAPVALHTVNVNLNLQK
jgi:hypothetical protein